MQDFSLLGAVFSAEQCAAVISERGQLISTTGEFSLRQHWAAPAWAVDVFVAAVARCVDLKGTWLNVPTIQLFEDPPGYTIRPHVDTSANMNLNAQVYLTEHPGALGTAAWIDGKEVLAPYRAGSGYVLWHPNRITHGMIKTVPPGHTRWSMYASWRTQEVEVDY